MLEPSRINRLAMEAVREAIRPGVTTLELNQIALDTIRSHGAESNFAQVPGFRYAICPNVNDVVVHGVPTDDSLQPGDIVTIDCGAVFKGWHSDAAFSVVLPDPARPELVASRQRLSDVTEKAMWAGIAELSRARFLNSVGVAIEEVIARESDYTVLEDYIGHGIGRSMHENPPVFNYAVRGQGPQVKPGLVVAIEPIVSAGAAKAQAVNIDGWDIVKIADGSDSCQWEHTVAVHSKGIWVLTAEDGGAKQLAEFGVTPRPIA